MTVRFFSADSEGGTGGNIKVKQATKLNIVAPHETVMNIPFTNKFDKLPLEVLKMEGGDKGVVEVLCNFDNADCTDFEENEFVEFDGVMRLKKDYKLQTEIIDEIEGVYSLDLNQWNQFKKLIPFGKVDDEDDMSLLPIISSNLSSEMRVTASSEYTPAFQAFQAFDGTDKYWTAMGTENQWISWELVGKQVIPARYSIKADSGASSKLPMDFDLQGWNSDKQTWDTLDARRDVEWSKLEEKTFDVTEIDRHYNRFRVFSYRVSSSQVAFTSINEIKMFGRILNNKYLLKKDDKILTIKSGELVETIFIEPLKKIDFEKLGFIDLDLLLGRDLSNTKLLISSYTEDAVPIVNVKAIPYQQLIFPTGDITLNMLDKIHHFNIKANQVGGGKVRIIFSVDKGANWLTYKDGDVVEIDTNNLDDVKVNGLNPDEFNAIGGVWDTIVTDDRIKFAYYLEIDDIDDIAEIDELQVGMDMHGRWKKAEHINDYDYEYDNEHIYVSFFKDGSYKVNYQK